MAPSPPAALRVDLGERGYDIHIGAGLLARASRLIRATAGARGFVITHPAIAKLHGEALTAGLGDLDTQTIAIPAGERQKSLSRASALWTELLTRGADRRSVVIAFGGGVVGDLAGFVAATYMRGVPYVQVPTTLLAQVDSSVGGKVAINHPQAKNLIGAFYQPRLVLADVSTLLTLPAREYRSGLAEVVKHAAIADARLFAWLREHRAGISDREPEVLAPLVRRNCEIKVEVVRKDEREEGLRAILNFGHTVGHALESLSDYRTLRHGEGVAIGMVVAARIATLLGLASKEVEQDVCALLEAFGLPTRIPETSAAAIVHSMKADKKSLGGAPRFVLPRALGKMELGCEVPAAVVKKAIRGLGASA